MKAKNLRGWTDGLPQDVDFKRGSIFPFNCQDRSLCYGGEKVTVNSVIPVPAQ